MSDLNLDVIRARESAATKGPWTAGGDVIHPWEVVISPHLPLVELSDGIQGEANAAFIAHAREDIPALLAKVEQLEVRLHQHRLTAYERTKEANDLRAELAANEDSEDARLAIAEQRVRLARGVAEQWAASTDVVLASAGRALLNTLGGAR